MRQLDVAIVYGIMYAFFGAYPIIFQDHRGFDAGKGGLCFLGMGVGTMMGTWTAPIQNRIYWKAMRESPTGRAPPEALSLPFFSQWTCN
jgi:hypothetical protein